MARGEERGEFKGDSYTHPVAMLGVAEPTFRSVNMAGLRRYQINSVQVRTCRMVHINQVTENKTLSLGWVSQTYHIVKGQLLVTVNVRAETILKWEGDIKKGARIVAIEATLMGPEWTYGFVCSMETRRYPYFWSRNGAAATQLRGVTWMTHFVNRIQRRRHKL